MTQTWKNEAAKLDSAMAKPTVKAMAKAMENDAVMRRQLTPMSLQISGFSRSVIRAEKTRQGEGRMLVGNMSAATHHNAINVAADATPIVGPRMGAQTGVEDRDRTTDFSVVAVSRAI
jgi:hypothetical protein